MRIAILTKEFPPHIYGGAGVHVDFLTRELAALAPKAHQVDVYCFGEQNGVDSSRNVHGVQADLDYRVQDPRHCAVLDTLLTDTLMLGALQQADIVHCHTWYTHLTGCLARRMHGIPLILTTHSLEPHRPWKREQLGSGYEVSSWLERTAYENADGVVAVSKKMREDVRQLYGVPSERIDVIHNGIDCNRYRPRRDPEVLERYGVDPKRPFILLVTRITRQKGILHFLNAAKLLKSDVQVVLCAGAPDTKEILGEVSSKEEEVSAVRGDRVVWIEENVPVDDLVVLYTHASVFVCPSVYEPFGIINLEAMACGTPVAASAVGGIPEVVVEGETGRLVHFEAVGPDNPEPVNPEAFAGDLASAVDSMLSNPEKRAAMGRRARRRAEEHFSWTAIAGKTLAFYERVIRAHREARASED